MEEKRYLCGTKGTNSTQRCKGCRSAEAQRKDGGQENVKKIFATSALKDLFAIRFKFMKIVNKIYDFGSLKT